MAYMNRLGEVLCSIQSLGDRGRWELRHLEYMAFSSLPPRTRILEGHRQVLHASAQKWHMSLLPMIHWLDLIPWLPNCKEAGM